MKKHFGCFYFIRFNNFHSLTLEFFESNRLHANSLLGGHLRVHFYVTRLLIGIVLTSYRTLCSNQCSCRRIHCVLCVSLNSSEKCWVWTWKSKPMGKSCISTIESWIVSDWKLLEKFSASFFSINFNKFIIKSLSFWKETGCWKLHVRR